MQKDIRVAIIKLFDRLHNMETLGYHGNSEKERSIAKETLDVHVKIAAKLGLFQVKYDLEQYSLPYFDPKAFQRIEVVKTRQREAALKILPNSPPFFRRKILSPLPLIFTMPRSLP
jgi:guanosine-3',5'-bis(diphosphate) 3'-pyrophosphohydrolase